MNPVSTFVQTATYDFSPSELRLNQNFWKGFIALNKVHSIWRYFRYYEVYSNPNNLSQLLAGRTLNFIAGDRVLIRIAAQCLLIATKILESVEQQIALNEALISWKNAFFGYYAKPIKDCRKDQAFITSVKMRHELLSNRIQRIYICTILLIKQAFRLSMILIDAIDAFSFSPHTRSDAINESFVNAVKWIDVIVDNKEALLNGCIENRLLLEKILASSPITYEQLYQSMTKVLEKTEKIQITTKKISNYGNGILVDTGKRTIDEIMVTLGLARLRPLFLA